MTGVVIAAHNEASVIGRCLDNLLADSLPDEFEIVVVANGCDDATATIAAARNTVRVIELAEPSKPAALNAGDAAIDAFPRIYLDADIVLTTAGARALRDALLCPPKATRPAGCPTLAAVPRRTLDLRARPLMVRAYFAINSRLPVFRHGLFGRGAIAVSRAGRARFERFPDMVADDLFLDSVFDQGEKSEVDQIETVVAAPLRTRDLVRRLVRVRRGNAAMRAAAREGQVTVPVRNADRFSWLRDVIVPEPRLAPAAVVYVAITVWAAFLARRNAGAAEPWGQDNSTRPATPIVRGDSCA
ncbi:glycosyltransferase involved in cell wall biosynthesis [Antricoccus suffuscus]|uniref:4,4'-diaponeurosporenoate glycosyltransferase n=1 Tax=Antricoccus suffuscus TaxID=1629062 RepID=A0A2T1A1W7_9ACTN|nr:glycosyltransferase [Antricoccus suffuscus]PRZ42487.1 glycosyltransferase involved in cell wall biosynthesis [Antricoccus suffuscus]